MKAAICTPLDLNKNGGVEKHILCLAEAMRGLGLDIDVFGGTEPADDVDRSFLTGSNTGEEFQSLSEFKPENYSIIHTHSGQFCWPFVNMIRSRPAHQRHVHTMHNSALEYAIACNAWLNWRVYSASLIEGFWGHYADHVIAVSQPVRRRASSCFGLEATKISLIGNGAVAFDTPAESREQTRAQLDLASDNIVVLFVGRGEDKVKGTEAITASMAQLQQRFPNTRLMAVPGTGFNGQEWICRTGPVNHRKMLNCYAAADIFVNASLDEGLPLTIVEAMAAGLPIVAAPVGGIPEVITHNQTGLLLRGDRSDLAERLAQVIEDVSLRDRLGQTAAIAAKELTWKTIARKTIAVYESLTANSPENR